jgi:hypothetical protein
MRLKIRGNKVTAFRRTNLPETLYNNGLPLSVTRLGLLGSFPDNQLLFQTRFGAVSAMDAQDD